MSSEDERDYAEEAYNEHLMHDPDDTGQMIHPRCPVCGGLNPGDVTHTRC